MRYRPNVDGLCALSVVSNVNYVDLNDALCRELDCKVFGGKEPLYYYEHHLSRSSARTVSPVFDHIFAAARSGGSVR